MLAYEGTTSPPTNEGFRECVIPSTDTVNAKCPPSHDEQGHGAGNGDHRPCVGFVVAIPFAVTKILRQDAVDVETGKEFPLTPDFFAQHRYTILTPLLYFYHS